MNPDQSFRGDSGFFLQSMRATGWKNLNLSQIHFGSLKVTKLIRPRLLSVNRKLWSKKSLPYPTFNPTFLWSYVLRSKSKSKTHLQTNSTLAA